MVYISLVPFSDHNNTAIASSKEWTSEADFTSFTKDQTSSTLLSGSLTLTGTPITPAGPVVKTATLTQNGANTDFVPSGQWKLFAPDNATPIATSPLSPGEYRADIAANGSGGFDATIYLPGRILNYAGAWTLEYYYAPSGIAERYSGTFSLAAGEQGAYVVSGSTDGVDGLYYYEGAGSGAHATAPYFKRTSPSTKYLYFYYPSLGYTPYQWHIGTTIDQVSAPGVSNDVTITTVGPNHQPPIGTVDISDSDTGDTTIGITIANKESLSYTYTTPGTAYTSYDSTATSLWNTLTKTETLNSQTITYYGAADTDATCPTVPAVGDAGTALNWTNNGWTALSFTGSASDLTALDRTRYLCLGVYMATADTSVTPTLDALALEYDPVTITVTSPETGACFLTGTGTTIPGCATTSTADTSSLVWTVTGEKGTDHIKIQYAADGASYSNITGATSLGTAGPYTWTLPTTGKSTGAKVKVILEDATNTEVISDESGAFTIHSNVTPGTPTITGP